MKIINLVSGSVLFALWYCSHTHSVIVKNESVVDTIFPVPIGFIAVTLR